MELRRQTYINGENQVLISKKQVAANLGLGYCIGDYCTIFVGDILSITATKIET